MKIQQFYFLVLSVSFLFFSCTPDPVEGCTDELACNYDADAEEDDGSCQYAATNADCNGDCLEGYIDVQGDCVLIVEGCTDPFYVEYDPTANVDDGSCQTLVIEGCTDPTAFNYDPTANVDDGSCVEVVFGCTDSTACNYNESANINDNSCLYIENLCDYCSGEVDGTGTVVDGDSDNDGLCDIEDSCPNDPLNDIDNDGVCGDEDNCPEEYNPEQEDSDGDGDGDACEISLNEELSYSFNVYPNPAQELLNIIYTSNNFEDFDLKIFNSVGQLVMFKEYSALKELSVQIAVNEYDRGMYQIQLINTHSTTNKWVVLQ